MNTPIITLSTGYFKPDLIGTARFEHIKVVFLGPNHIRTEIPTYLVTINGSKHEKGDCQPGRDFNFLKTEH